MPLQDTEPEWPEYLIPEEFVLASLRLAPKELPIRPILFEGKGPDWVQTSYHSTYDWNWTLLPEFTRYSFPEKAYRELAAHWKETGTKVWMSIVEAWPRRPENLWLLVDGEIATMAAADSRREGKLSRVNGTVFLITEDGGVIASHGGAWSLDELFLSQKLLSGGSEFQWPLWTQTITSRHRDVDWGNELAEAFEDDNFHRSYSFFSFCVESWKNYVFGQLWNGSDQAVQHVLETMRMLDLQDDGQGLTVWDDLAMVYYTDHPPQWILRLWQFMNPLELWIDMTTTESMKPTREKALKRDYALAKKYNRI